MVTIVMPRRERAFRVFMMEFAAVASRPEVGSSRNKALEKNMSQRILGGFEGSKLT